jgi:3-dehydroquinate synthase
MSLLKELKIRSKIMDYSVKFTDIYEIHLIDDIVENAFVVVDKNVLKIYGEKLLSILPADRTIIIEAVEKNKSFEKLNPIIKTLLEHNIRRKDKLVAIGGGITQDITAFIASILFRGIDWVFYPTTLLAQADSCIGSKTSINFGGYKNQIGTWYPPSKIIIDKQFLITLSKQDILSGMGEIVKINLINGKYNKLNLYLDSGVVVDWRKTETAENMIYKSLEIKKRYIEEDEFDKGRRNVLNYGHTFGHAIEVLSNNKIPHGIAVAMGMRMANYISWKFSYLADDSYREMELLLIDIYIKYPFDISRKEIFLNALLKDKKNTGKNLTAILTRGIGKMEKMEVTQDMLRCLITEMADRKTIW